MSHKCSLGKRLGSWESHTPLCWFVTTNVTPCVLGIVLNKSEIPSLEASLSSWKEIVFPIFDSMLLSPDKIKLKTDWRWKTGFICTRNFRSVLYATSIVTVTAFTTDPLLQNSTTRYLAIRILWMFTCYEMEWLMSSVYFCSCEAELVHFLCCIHINPNETPQELLSFNWQILAVKKTAECAGEQVTQLEVELCHVHSVAAPGFTAWGGKVGAS